MINIQILGIMMTKAQEELHGILSDKIFCPFKFILLPIGSGMLGNWHLKSSYVDEIEMDTRSEIYGSFSIAAQFLNTID